MKRRKYMVLLPHAFGVGRYLDDALFAALQHMPDYLMSQLKLEQIQAARGHDLQIDDMGRVTGEDSETVEWSDLAKAQDLLETAVNAMQKLETVLNALATIPEMREHVDEDELAGMLDRLDVDRGHLFDWQGPIIERLGEEKN